MFNINSTFSAILFLYSLDLNKIFEYRFPSKFNSSCIKNQLPLESSKILIAISNYVNQSYFVIRLYQYFPVNNLVDSFNIFNSSTDSVPILINSLNQLIIAQSTTDYIGSKSIVEFHFYDFSLTFLFNKTLIYPKDIVVKTMLINLNDEITVGGRLYYSSRNNLWIAHLKKDNTISNQCTYGQEQSSALSSYYLSKRIQLFVGYSQLRTENLKVIDGDYSYLSLFLYFSDYGRLLNFLSLSYSNFEIFTGFKNMEELNLFGIEADTKLFQIKPIYNIIFPRTAPFIDEIENGCFSKCLLSIIHNTSFQCNPKVEGCDKIGKILDGYSCRNRILVKDKEKPSPYALKINATMINSGQILVSFNNTMKSSGTKLSATIIKQGSKPAKTEKIILEDYIQVFDDFIMTFSKPSELKCLNSLVLDLSNMFIKFKNDSYLKETIIPVSNTILIPCDNKLSATDTTVINSSTSAVSSSSSVMLGGSALSMNPIGIISLLNCMNELMIFQLLNCEPIYPSNINSFLNSTSFFSFNFLYNPIILLVNASDIMQDDWLINNIGKHSSLQGS